MNIRKDNSDEVLSKQVNSSEEVLSSSVIVYSNHVYKVGKYTFKLSDKQYKDIKNRKVHYVRVNSKDSKTVKIPKYKNKKVIKCKWKYKKVRWEGLTRYPYTGIKLANLKSYYNSGWKKVTYGYETAYNSNRFLGYNYAILKKKVYYTKTKKVKSGYKKVKLKVSTQIGLTGENFDELYIHVYIGINLILFHIQCKTHYRKKYQHRNFHKNFLKVRHYLQNFHWCLHCFPP